MHLNSFQALYSFFILFPIFSTIFFSIIKFSSLQYLYLSLKLLSINHQLNCSYEKANLFINLCCSLLSFVSVCSYLYYFSHFMKIHCCNLSPAHVFYQFLFFSVFFLQADLRLNNQFLWLVMLIDLYHRMLLATLEIVLSQQH